MNTEPEILAAIARARFIEDHHHLISPWAYSAPEIVQRNRMLFLRRVAASQK